MSRRIFLERRTYRKNRLQDAARLLPVLGIILFFGPVFIIDDSGADAGTSMADWLVYCFVVWVGLIAMTGLVNRALARSDPGPPPVARGQGADPAPDRQT